jgi:histone H3/H4
MKDLKLYQKWGSSAVRNIGQWLIQQDLKKRGQIQVQAAVYSSLTAFLGRLVAHVLEDAIDNVEADGRKRVMVTDITTALADLNMEELFLAAVESAKEK